VKTNWKIFEETIKESGMDLSALASKTETLRACTNIHSLINKAIDIAVLLITPKINLQRGGQKSFQYSDKPYENTNEFLYNDRVIEPSLIIAKNFTRMAVSNPNSQT
jgi:hypothetical protein